MQTTRASLSTCLLMTAAKLAAPIAATCLALAVLMPARGADYIWSPAGAGTWDLTTQHFLDGVTPISWDLVDPLSAEAVFAGTGGAVMIGSAIQLNKLTFDSSDYSIMLGAGDGLTFVGSTPTIWINKASTAIFAKPSPDSSSTITGAVLVIDGGGTFQFGQSHIIGNAT